MLETLWVKPCSIEYYFYDIITRYNYSLLKNMLKSKNVSRADNQQERLIKIGWIVGFVDGEGCFSINFVKQPDRKAGLRIRKGYKIGYQIAYDFTTVQGESSLRSLKKMKNYFKVGGIYINRRKDNHKENLYRYCVRRKEDLLNVIIPFFQKYPLQTVKRKDFELFVKCMKLIEKNKHLTKAGAIKIAQLSEKMNHKKSRANLIRILRNQT